MLQPIDEMLSASFCPTQPFSVLLPSLNLQETVLQMTGFPASCGAQEDLGEHP